MLPLLILVSLSSIVDAISCRICTDGKILHNDDLYPEFIFPKKGVHPSCNSMKSDYELEYSDCETSCLSIDLVGRGRTIGRVRLCGKDAHTDHRNPNGTFRLAPVLLARYRYELLANYCQNEDDCNDDFDRREVFRSSSTPRTRWVEETRETILKTSTQMNIPEPVTEAAVPITTSTQPVNSSSHFHPKTIITPQNTSFDAFISNESGLLSSLGVLSFTIAQFIYYS